jgi:hypothetical protein
MLLPQSHKLVQRAPSTWKLDDHAFVPHVEVSHRRLSRFVAAQLYSTTTPSQSEARRLSSNVQGQVANAFVNLPVCGIVREDRVDISSPSWGS